MQRRSFIQLTALAGAGLMLPQCRMRSGRQIPGAIVGASASIGHILRDGAPPGAPEKTQYTDVVIVGGGVSGLSAARWLQKQGIDRFLVLDLEKQTGGNAASGANHISPYPWGAHYVPIPNNDLVEYLSFLEEHEVITGYNAGGLPIYNEYHLCFAPEERLYIHGMWQEGLVPHVGVPHAEQQQILRFLEQMDIFRKAKGGDGKDAFAIPVQRSSRDERFLQLDRLTMKAWLLQNNYTSSYLHWYCDYCTRDDFGTRYDAVSAWAGIHYFAGRKGMAANAESHDVLTWPKGNAWLTDKLQKDYTDNIRVNSLVTAVEENGNNVVVTFLDITSRKWQRIIARKCIIAAPQFIAQRLLKQPGAGFSYSPWMVANITSKTLQERSGAMLCWDNVIYGSESLGYVDATHQLLQQHIPEKVFTYYLPLTSAGPATERKRAMGLQHADWVNIILNDLQKVHENIAEAVQHIDVMVWGHAMVQPVVNSIQHVMQGYKKGKAIFLAHTDLAGISIFEEGFYQGIHAAEAVIQSLRS